MISFPVASLIFFDLFKSNISNQKIFMHVSSMKGTIQFHSSTLSEDPFLHSWTVIVQESDAVLYLTYSDLAVPMTQQRQQAVSPHKHFLTGHSRQSVIQSSTESMTKARGAYYILLHLFCLKQSFPSQFACLSLCSSWLRTTLRRKDINTVLCTLWYFKRQVWKNLNSTFWRA